MLTNLRDAFIGQRRPPNIVPFHILGIVSYCATVTLSFKIFDFKKCRAHTHTKIINKWKKMITGNWSKRSCDSDAGI